MRCFKCEGKRCLKRSACRVFKDACIGAISVGRLERLAIDGLSRLSAERLDPDVKGVLHYRRFSEALELPRASIPL